jgi:hypothetical protein
MYRPSKRPSVKQVHVWEHLFEDSIDLSWRGAGQITCKVENGAPFFDFYRVTYTIDGVKKSKLFYGESAENSVRRFVYDMGFYGIDMVVL